MSKATWCWLVVGTLVSLAPRIARADNKKVCVEVVLERAATAPEGVKPPGRVVAGSDADVLPPAWSKAKLDLPIGQRPLGYLKRLLEYYVTHEKGFVAVQSDCQETITVQLYPLLDGWTAFARYSGTGREERVDQLEPQELSPFAERAVTALLYAKPIASTINRATVLRSDSKQYDQRIGGTHHFMMGIGTQLRVGVLPTAVTTGARSGGVADSARFFSPVALLMGYRGRYESWGLEANVMAAFDFTSGIAAKLNPQGGHVDFDGDAALQLHFLHYFDPRGLVSFYAGAGATFELLSFEVVRATALQSTGSRSNLLDGGLDIDLLVGWEFMRASSAQFYLQAEAQAPAYVLSNQNNDGLVHNWFPATTVKLGVMF